MIAFIRGVLIQASPTYAIVEANGIGHLIYLPASALSRLPAVQNPILLHTCLVIREMSQTLYGFFEPAERDLFETLLSVSSIGPKTALSIIGHLSTEQLSDAVQGKKINVICKIPGIGPKTAERLIFEIKDKLAQILGKSAHAKDPKSQLIQDAMSTLIHLGYHQSAAEKAVKKTLERHPDQLNLAELVPLSLQNI